MEGRALMVLGACLVLVERREVEVEIEVEFFFLYFDSVLSCSLQGTIRQFASAIIEISISTIIRR